MSKRDEEIIVFCNLRREVASEVFNWREPADCLCNETNDAHFHSSESVLSFIQTAVREKIVRENELKNGRLL